MSETLNQEQLKRLLHLQEVDKALDALQASIDRIPIDIEKLRATLAGEKNRVERSKDKATKLQLARKEKELSLSQKEDSVRKHGTELNAVKTNEAYKALLSEIEKAKTEASDLETAILTLMDEIDATVREEKEASAVLKEAEGRTQKEVQTLETEKAGLCAKLQSDKTARESIAAGIPADTLKIYDYLRKRKQGQAMAPINGNICGACRIMLLPQSLVELARGNQLITCDACQRILYDPQALSAPPTTGARQTHVKAAESEDAAKTQPVDSGTEV